MVDLFESLIIIAPELILAITAMSLLMIGSFYQKKSINLINTLAFLTLLILSFNELIFNNIQIFAFNGFFIEDKLSSFAKFIIFLTSALSIIMSANWLRNYDKTAFEFPILILFSTLGMALMVSANDLVSLYLAIELQSLPLYVLATFNRNDSFSSESGVKYFILGALSSGLLLYGSSLIYGFTGTIFLNEISQLTLSSNQLGITFGLAFLLAGIVFKISAVPFHMWAPDVYQGSPTSVTVLFAILPKIAALTVFIKFLYGPFINLFEEWQAIIIFLSIASMILGAVAAIGQKNLKRLIAYSSISHMGYALAGLTTGTNQGIQSSIIYLIIYLIMNLAFFSCLFMLKRKDKFYENIEDLSGLSKKHPILALSFLIILFSLAGIPPLAGFFAKFYIFMAVIQKEMYFLAIVGLLATVIAAFYYLRVIKIIYFDPEQEKFDTSMSLGLKLTLILTTSVILMYFLNPNFLNKYITNILVI